MAKGGLRRGRFSLPTGRHHPASPSAIEKTGIFGKVRWVKKEGRGGHPTWQSETVRHTKAKIHIPPKPGRTHSCAIPGRYPTRPYTLSVDDM